MTEMVTTPTAPHHQVSGRSLPAVGAFAIDLPPPMYAMEDDDDGEWERFPTEEFQPRRPTATTTTTQEALVLQAEVQAAPLPPPPVNQQEQETVNQQDNGKRKRLYWIGGAVCLIVVAVVVIVVAVAGGGSDGPAAAGGGALAPTVAPATNRFGECFERTKQIELSMIGRTEYSQFIRVKLCAQSFLRVFKVNRGQHSGALQPVLTLQSNMTLQCGEDGNLYDQCVVDGGGGGLTLLLHEYIQQGDGGFQFEPIYTAENGKKLKSVHI